MWEFTVGQMARVRSLLAIYRPRLLER
jgi:hypothetical protein